MLAPRWNVGDVSCHVRSNHSVHVLNLTGQAGHRHGVEVGVSNFQGGLHQCQWGNTLSVLGTRLAGAQPRKGSPNLTVIARMTRDLCSLNVTFTTLMPSSSTRTECGNRKKTTKPDARRQSRIDRRTYCLLQKTKYATNPGSQISRANESR